jgi:mono/diheme cytochrome c family protein
LKPTIAIIAAIGVWAGVVAHAARQGDWPQTPAATTGLRSTLDGVYTNDQADRGQAAYRASCGQCHGGTLEGGEEAPPLAGTGFISNWKGLTMGDLFDRIRKSMPDDKPGSLSPQQYSDTLAFLLRANGFPAGTVELDTDSARLKQVRIDPMK